MVVDLLWPSLSPDLSGMLLSTTIIKTLNKRISFGGMLTNTGAVLKYICVYKNIKHSALFSTVTSRLEL